MSYFINLTLRISVVIIGITIVILPRKISKIRNVKFSPNYFSEIRTIFL